MTMATIQISEPETSIVSMTHSIYRPSSPSESRLEASRLDTFFYKFNLLSFICLLNYSFYSNLLRAFPVLSCDRLHYFTFLMVVAVLLNLKRLTNFVTGYTFSFI